MSIEIITYRKHRNLKLAANELGIAWQELYVRLKKIGEPVTGDKLLYGSDRDKLGALAEAEFKKFVPHSIDKNAEIFQAKIDFNINGYLIDVKASKPKLTNKNSIKKAWSFSFKKQTLIADFIVCFCYLEDKSLAHVLLVPSEFFKGLQTVSVSCSAVSKWLDYSIDPKNLSDFFKSLPIKGC
tara:strand:- start:14316 stop:14864 length:549 start_codon:yes stop_codon:yes gene_type:complete